MIYAWSKGINKGKNGTSKKEQQKKNNFQRQMKIIYRAKFIYSVEVNSMS